MLIDAELLNAKADKKIYILIPDSLLFNWDGETVFITPEAENDEIWFLFNTAEEAVQGFKDMYLEDKPASAFTQANINDLHDKYFPEAENEAQAKRSGTARSK